MAKYNKKLFIIGAVGYITLFLLMFVLPSFVNPIALIVITCSFIVLYSIAFFRCIIPIYAHTVTKLIC